MKVVITQPNFLPWLGYLAQIASCDVFVCLDSVQFTRREWQNRNRIVSRQGKIDFLSVNVKSGARSDTILDTVISDTYNPMKLQNKISAYYHGCPRVREAYEVCGPLYAAYHRPGRSLATANLEHLIHLINLMGLPTQVICSSQLEHNLSWATPTERLLSICQSLGATAYLSSPAARIYMEDELDKFSASGIEVLWQNFTHSSYINSGPFVSHLSCVDFLNHRSIDELLPYLLKECAFTPESNYC